MHKRDGHGTDKVATIYGAPEACGVAANRILDIIRKEERDDELPLKLLAHNALIGRLIGRDGRNLKQIQVKHFFIFETHIFRLNFIFVDYTKSNYKKVV